jgi:hypothetical protein
MLIVYTILAIFSVSAVFFFIGIADYNEHIKKLAETHTEKEIEEKIKKDTEELKNTNYKGAILENILNHKELWENVKKYKTNTKNK